MAGDDSIISDGLGALKLVKSFLSSPSARLTIPLHRLPGYHGLAI
jgi:hypothetical protein